VLLADGNAAQNAAIALILAGMCVPAFGVAWQATRDLASLHALRDIWEELTDAIPAVSAGPVRPGPAAAVRSARIRLIRRTAEIRDAALALRCYVPPGAVAEARRRLASLELSGAALDAAAEACWLKLAIRAMTAGAPASEPSHRLPGGDTLRDEVRWLRQVSAAIRLPQAAAVADGIAGGHARATGRLRMAAAQARTESKSFAKHVTDNLEPKNWIIATALLIGWHSDRFAGAGWGLLGALFAAILPTVFIRYGMRRGRWADRHVGAREHRLIVMAFIIASVGTGLGLLLGLGAPRPVTAMTVTMLASIIVLMAITVKWKISVHCAVSSGATVMLALTWGAPWLACYTLVGLVAWSRAELKDHTPAQAAAGTALGAASALIFLALR
jgi:hypothetical protein